VFPHPVPSACTFITNTNESRKSLHSVSVLFYTTVMKLVALEVCKVKACTASPYDVPGMLSLKDK
jgi:hypothetical protein